MVDNLFHFLDLLDEFSHVIFSGIFVPFLFLLVDFLELGDVEHNLTHAFNLTCLITLLDKLVRVKLCLGGECVIRISVGMKIVSFDSVLKICQWKIALKNCHKIFVIDDQLVSHSRTLCVRSSRRFDCIRVAVAVSLKDVKLEIWKWAFCLEFCCFSCTRKRR